MRQAVRCSRRGSHSLPSVTRLNLESASVALTIKINLHVHRSSLLSFGPCFPGVEPRSFNVSAYRRVGLGRGTEASRLGWVTT